MTAAYATAKLTFDPTLVPQCAAGFGTTTALYVLDQNNNVVRKVALQPKELPQHTAQSSPWVGDTSGTDKAGSGTSCGLKGVYGAAMSPDSRTLYVSSWASNWIQKIDMNSTKVTLIAGNIGATGAFRVRHTTR